MFNTLLWKITQQLGREESLVVNEANCLLQYNRFIDCKKCEEACPAQAITIKKNRPVLQEKKCAQCGLCIGICPSSVFDYSLQSDFTLLKAAVKKSHHSTLSFICGKMSGGVGQNKENVIVVPCFLRLSHVFLLLGIALDINIEIPIGRCLSLNCPQKAHLALLLEEELEKTESMIPGASSKIQRRDDLDPTERVDTGSLSRRNFLQLFKNGANDIKEKTIRITEDMIESFIDEEDETSLLRYNAILLFLLTKIKEGQPHLFERINVLPFQWIKIEEHCVYCQKCFKLCPTKALSAKDGSISFCPSYCLYCGICHQCCDYGALSFEDQIAVATFLKKEKRQILDLELHRCKTCSVVFSPTKEEPDFCFVCSANKKKERFKA